MWPIIIAVLVLIILIVVIVEVILYVYNFLISIWPLTLTVMLGGLTWYAIRYYYQHARFPDLEDRIEFAQQEYKDIFTRIDHNISVSEEDLPPTHHFKYLYSSPDPVEKQLSYLLASAKVYKSYINKTQETSLLLNEKALKQLIIDFDPFSYNSEEALKTDIEQLSTVLDCYQQYSTAIGNRGLRTHVIERELVPPTPTSVDDLVSDIEEIVALAEFVEIYVDSMDSFSKLTNQEEVGFGRIQAEIDDEMSDLEDVDDLRIMSDKFRYLGRLFYTHNQVSSMDTTAKKYKKSEIISFAERVITGKFTQSTKCSINAYSEFASALEDIQLHRGKRLNRSTSSELRDTLSYCEPLESPRNTIEISTTIIEALPVLNLLEDVTHDVLLSKSEDIHKELLNGIKTHSITKEDIADYDELVTTASNLSEFLKENRTHPNIDASEWESEIKKALEERYPKRLKPLSEQRERMLDNYWEKDDLYKFDWQEFEELIGALFKAEGYEVEVTDGTHDLGVDVYAEDEGSRMAIQVKQFGEGNRVGREPLQKLASTLANDSADKIVIITSSAFAKTAKDYARDFGSEIQLINGSELVHRLVDAEIPPPS